MTFDERVALIKKDFPRFQVKSYLDNWFFAFLWRLGWRMSATTIGYTIFMDPDDLGTTRGAETLRHEIVHVRDMHDYGFLFWLSYLFLLPIGPSFRAFWEWRGYREDLRALWEEYKDFRDPAYRDYIMEHNAEWVAKQFWSINYLWMWPFPGMVRGWVDREIERIKKT